MKHQAGAAVLALTTLVSAFGCGNQTAVEPVAAAKTVDAPPEAVESQQATLPSTPAARITCLQNGITIYDGFFAYAKDAGGYVNFPNYLVPDRGDTHHSNYRFTDFHTKRVTFVPAEGCIVDVGAPVPENFKHVPALTPAVK